MLDTLEKYSLSSKCIAFAGDDANVSNGASAGKMESTFTVEKNPFFGICL